MLRVSHTYQTDGLILWYRPPKAPCPSQPPITRKLNHLVYTSQINPQKTHPYRKSDAHRTRLPAPAASASASTPTPPPSASPCSTTNREPRPPKRLPSRRDIFVVRVRIAAANRASRFLFAL